MCNGPDLNGAGRRRELPGRSSHTRISSPAFRRSRTSAGPASPPLTNTFPRSRAAAAFDRDASRSGAARNLSSVWPASAETVHVRHRSVHRSRFRLADFRLWTLTSGTSPASYHKKPGFTLTGRLKTEPSMKSMYKPNISATATAGFHCRRRHPGYRRVSTGQQGTRTSGYGA